uniref:Protein inscuteable homologue C-terminal domain-containing protein n=1 Tax=Glossina palpalis gambiensis TaxID=67801 RepID=A0A1B0B216_9MUSC
MSFQRSYSKVWWGSEHQSNSNINNPHMFVNGSNNLTDDSSNSHSSSATSSRQQQEHHGEEMYHSLDSNHYKRYTGNLSCIQEHEDEYNSSKLSWPIHNSPGSLRSQDSGFSDNDDCHIMRTLSGRSSKRRSPSNRSSHSSKSQMGSPSSTRSPAETPPTIVRRAGRSEFYTPLVNVTRRISFGPSPTKIEKKDNFQEDNEDNLMCQLDGTTLVSNTSLGSPIKTSEVSSSIVHANLTMESSPISRVKRRKKVERNSFKPLSPTHKRETKCIHYQQEAEESSFLNALERTSLADYSNETVCVGEQPLCSTPPPPYNNETVILGGLADGYQQHFNHESVLSLRSQAQFEGFTSTPKKEKFYSSPTCTPRSPFKYTEYENSLLNGHSPSLHSWLDNLRFSYDHEVMSTLQTKSITLEAYKNFTITTHTVARLLRQLQQKALNMQTMFERVEQSITKAQPTSLPEALRGSTKLIEEVQEFTQILRRRTVFFSESRIERKRYEDHLDQIRMVAKDTLYSLEHQHYINLQSLLDDVQVLKRNLLITIRQVYVKLIKILIQSIERCGQSSDLMLRANINMIATLMNIEYDGFASLTDAFVQAQAVRTLLIVCLDHPLSSVRALALRALATVCCTPEPIAQVDSCGGIEILRDILQAVGSLKKPNEIKRGDTERREAVSLLTQITAPWHGPEHKVVGLKDSLESIVEGLTQLLVFTDCPQTLLLCAAALNNLSRMEITAHYSVMSHETISKLIEMVRKRTDQEEDEGISVFLYEQIVSMLYNMSLNKKCHSHLANVGIINFITSAYQTEIHRSYNSRGESEAQKRIIKYILHTLTRLIQDSVLGMELLEQQQYMPSAIFFNTLAADVKQQLPLDNSQNSQSHDISFLTRQLLQLQHKENLIQKSSQHHKQHQLQRQEQRQQVVSPKGDGTEKSKMQLARQESYV